MSIWRAALPLAKADWNTLVLGLADGSPRTIHLRCVTTPDAAQKVPLHRLGLTLPYRLRTVNEVEQM